MSFAPTNFTCRASDDADVPKGWSTITRGAPFTAQNIDDDVSAAYAAVSVWLPSRTIATVCEYERCVPSISHSRNARVPLCAGALIVSDLPVQRFGSYSSVAGSGPPVEPLTSALSTVTAGAPAKA